MITELISGLCLTDPDKLDGFIAGNPGLFMLHRDQGDYLPDFARYIVLSVLSLFAVKLKISAEEAERVKATGDFCPETASWEKTDESRGILTLYGCPTEKMLASLSDLRFRREGDLWASGAKEGAMLTEIYGDRENIALAGGKGTVFYSGTLIRPTHVECPETRYEDSGVSSVIVDFEKTTYATVFAMDGNYTGHPLLRDRRGKIVEFLRQDDREKGILIRELEKPDLTRDKRLEALNDYLEKCHNPNQIVVSGNVVTSDRLLLMSRRGSGAIDSGSLYPGVNGNAEIADRNVSFYGKSMYEDFPTIYLEGYRIDFMGEIGRETYAEVKLDLKREEWTCCGISLSGDRPPESAPDGECGYRRRRLHFNILFEQTVDKSFWETETARVHATEKFESEDFIGVSVRCYRSRTDEFIKRTLDLFRKISSQKDALESVLLLLLFLVTLLSRHAFSDEIWYTVMSLLLAAVIVLSSVGDTVRVLKRRRHVAKRTRRVTFYRQMTRDDEEEMLHRVLEGYSYHPAAYAALKLYADNRIRESFLRICPNNGP